MRTFNGKVAGNSVLLPPKHVRNNPDPEPSSSDSSSNTSASYSRSKKKKRNKKKKRRNHRKDDLSDPSLSDNYDSSDDYDAFSSSCDILPTLDRKSG